MTFYTEGFARTGNSSLAATLLATAKNVLRSRRQQDDLAFLSDYLLADIGLTRADVARAGRNVWL